MKTRASVAVYFVTALGAFLIVAGVVWVLLYNTRTSALNQARIDERLKNLREINAAGADGLNNLAWQDEGKGLVRLPVTNAMDLLVREWRNPAAGRSNLLARLEKANPPPPAPAPQKPSEFE